MLITVGSRLGTSSASPWRRCVSSSSREVGAASTLAWVMALGLGVLVVPIALVGRPSHLWEHHRTALCSGAQQRCRASPRIRGISIAWQSVSWSPSPRPRGWWQPSCRPCLGRHLPPSTILLLVVITVRHECWRPPTSIRQVTGRLDPGPRTDHKSLPGQVMRRLDGARTRSALLVIRWRCCSGPPSRHRTCQDAGTDHLGAAAGRAVRRSLCVASPLLARRKLRIAAPRSRSVLSAGVAEVVGLMTTPSERVTISPSPPCSIAECPPPPPVRGHTSSSPNASAARPRCSGSPGMIVGLVTLSALRVKDTAEHFSGQTGADLDPDMRLSLEQDGVIGALIEKQLATPADSTR